MKISELEDAHVLVTKTDLTQAMIEVREGLLAMRKEIGDLREEIRSKWWIPVLVSVGSSIVAPVLVYILTHHSQ